MMGYTHGFPNQVIFFPLVPELAYDLDLDDMPSNKQLLNPQTKDVSTVHNLGLSNVTPNPDFTAGILIASFLLWLK